MSRLVLTLSVVVAATLTSPARGQLDPSAFERSDYLKGVAWESVRQAAVGTSISPAKDMNLGEIPTQSVAELRQLLKPDERQQSLQLLDQWAVKLRGVLQRIRPLASYDRHLADGYEFNRKLIIAVEQEATTLREALLATPEEHRSSANASDAVQPQTIFPDRKELPDEIIEKVVEGTASVEDLRDVLNGRPPTDKPSAVASPFKPRGVAQGNSGRTTHPRAPLPPLPRLPRVPANDARQQTYDSSLDTPEGELTAASNAYASRIGGVLRDLQRPKFEMGPFSRPYSGFKDPFTFSDNGSFTLDLPEKPGISSKSAPPAAQRPKSDYQHDGDGLVHITFDEDGNAIIEDIPPPGLDALVDGSMSPDEFREENQQQYKGGWDSEHLKSTAQEKNDRAYQIDQELKHLEKMRTDGGIRSDRYDEYKQRLIAERSRLGNVPNEAVVAANYWSNILREDIETLSPVVNPTRIANEAVAIVTGFDAIANKHLSPAEMKAREAGFVLMAGGALPAGKLLEFAKNRIRGFSPQALAKARDVVRKTQQYTKNTVGNERGAIRVPGTKPGNMIGTSSSALVRSSLPRLPASFAKAFQGPVRVRTFKAGDKVYRSPWLPDEKAANPGAWFGTRATSTKQGTESMYNISKWNNPNEALRTYEFTQDTSVYFGQVKGGSGYQILIPRDVAPNMILKYAGEVPLK